jgi:hypothetical protein
MGEEQQSEWDQHWNPGVGEENGGSTAGTRYLGIE